MSKESDLDNSLNELLKELNAEIDGTPTSSSTSSTSSSGSSSSSEDSKAHYTLSSFPTEMSCSEAFDQLVACYSIGGQMRHIYRYGNISYCDGRWAKLRFCLRLKGIWDDEERAKRVSKYYMEKLAEKKKQTGSSEDVWSVRTVPVLNPFRDDLYALRDQNNSVDESSVIN